MISSQEFQQTLQAGKIHDALALLVRDAVEIDVTTHLTEDSSNSRIGSDAYLRTKINLLTGEIQNQVSQDIIANDSSYLKLQRLHIEQIVASERIIQSYLDQIKSILTALDPNSDSNSDRLDSDALVSRLNQFTLMLNNQQIGADPIFTRSSFADSPQTELPDRSNSSAVTDSIVFDEDLDLSIDLEGTVWEEWVEDEDLMPESVTAHFPPASPVLTIPDLEESFVRRQLNTIDLKPTPTLTNPELVPTIQWDKFVPEYIEIGADHHQFSNNSDFHQIDRSIADLNI